MTVNFQYVNVDVSESLSKHTEEKLAKLVNKYEAVISAQVFFKNDENDHNTGKICNIELSLPGPRIFATSNESSYEGAVNETIRDLKRQLEKRKQMQRTH